LISCHAVIYADKKRAEINSALDLPIPENLKLLRLKS